MEHTSPLESNTSKIELLIEILLDPNARDDEKDDAVIELGNYPNKKVEEVLLLVSNDPSFDEMIRASCGESLAEIWVKQSKLDISKLKSLTGIALQEALSLFQNKRPD